MNPLHRIPHLLSALLLAVQPAVGAVVEQGFAVEGDSIVELSVNGVVFTGSQLDDLFTIEHAQGFDRYLAKVGAFDGTEVLQLRAFAVDQAGNVSSEPAILNLGLIDTIAPQSPQIIELENQASDRYASGFSLPVGAFPVVTINGLVVQPDDLEQWFSLNTQAGFDLYEALPGVFDGSEAVEVSAYQLDIRGNESPYSELVRLRPIDTLSPGTPRIISLEQLLALPSTPSHKEKDRPMPPAGSMDLVEVVVQTREEVIEAQIQSDSVAGAPIAQTESDFDAKKDDIDAIIAKILAEPVPELNSVDNNPSEPVSLAPEYQIGIEDRSESQFSDAVEYTEHTNSADFDHLKITRAEIATLGADDDQPKAVSYPAADQSELIAPRSTQESSRSGDYAIADARFAADDKPIPEREAVTQLSSTSTNASNASNALVSLASRPQREVFNLKSGGDTLRLIKWMRLDPLSKGCSILETAEGAAIHEILDCLDRIGYPQAHMIELPDGIQIDTGERIQVNSADLRPADLAPAVAIDTQDRVPAANQRTELAGGELEILKKPIEKQSVKSILGLPWVVSAEFVVAPLVSVAQDYDLVENRGASSENQAPIVAQSDTFTTKEALAISTTVLHDENPEDINYHEISESDEADDLEARVAKILGQSVPEPTVRFIDDLGPKVLDSGGVGKLDLSKPFPMNTVSGQPRAQSLDQPLWVEAEHASGFDYPNRVLEREHEYDSRTIDSAHPNQGYVADPGISVSVATLERAPASSQLASTQLVSDLKSEADISNTVSFDAEFTELSTWQVAQGQQAVSTHSAEPIANPSMDVAIGLFDPEIALNAPAVDSDVLSVPVEPDNLTAQVAKILGEVSPQASVNPQQQANPQQKVSPEHEFGPLVRSSVVASAPPIVAQLGAAVPESSARESAGSDRRVASESSLGLAEQAPERSVHRAEASVIEVEPGLSVIQGNVSGDMLAATNGLDPFELLNIDKEGFKGPDESAIVMPPMTDQPITYVFDLREPEDTQRLLSWMRLESETLSCALLDSGDTGGSIDEILSCLDALGFPQAQSLELADGVRIDTGEKMRIESIGVNQVLDPSLQLAPSFMQELENKPLSKSQYVKAIDRLEGLGFVRNGSFDYYAKEPGVYDAELVGEAGQSQLSLGASLTSSGKLFGAVKGRHFFDYRGLRYLDYRVGSDIDGKYEIDLSAPLYYDLENQVDLEFKTAPMDYRYFGSRTTELAGRWRDFSGKSSLHLAEAGIGVSLHESDPKSDAGVTPQAVADQTLLRAELKANLSPGVVDGDKLSFGVDAGHNLSIGAGYVRADIDYDTGRIPVAQTGFMVKARVSGSAVLAGQEAVPLDQRLYLGGSDSVRGVKASYLGASKELSGGGGEQRIVSQVELFKPTTLFDQEVDLGVHFDAGNLSGGGNLEDSSAMSVGLFGRADLSENTSAYAYISRSNVESDAQSFFGISIVRKF